MAKKEYRVRFLPVHLMYPKITLFTATLVLPVMREREANEGLERPIDGRKVNASYQTLMEATVLMHEFV